VEKGANHMQWKNLSRHCVVTENDVERLARTATAATGKWDHRVSPRLEASQVTDGSAPALGNRVVYAGALMRTRGLESVTSII